MPEKVTAWKDDGGNLYGTEQEAENANKVFARLKLKSAAVEVIKQLTADGIFHFDSMERYNHDSLQPLADYLAVLIEESKERTRRFG